MLCLVWCHFTIAGLTLLQVCDRAATMFGWSFRCDRSAGLVHSQISLIKTCTCCCCCTVPGVPTRGLAMAMASCRPRHPSSSSSSHRSWQQLPEATAHS